MRCFLYVFTFPVVCVTSIYPSLMFEVTNLFIYAIDSLIPMESRLDRKARIMTMNPTYASYMIRCDMTHVNNTMICCISHMSLFVSNLCS